jgi:hypothetical protein
MTVLPIGHAWFATGEEDGAVRSVQTNGAR